MKLAGQDIIDMIPEQKQPKLLKRQRIIDRIRDTIKNIVDIFEW